MNSVKVRAINDNSLVSRSQTFRAYLDLKGYKVIKKFTFHHWKEDKLPYHYKIGEYGIHKSMIISPLYESWRKNNDGYTILNQQEYDKIREEKSRIYQLAVDKYIEARLFKYNNVTKGLSQLDTKDYLANEIELIENSLNNNLKREVFRGSKDLNIITPYIRKSILEEINNENEEKPSWKFQNDIIGSSNGIIAFKGLFAAYVNFGYLKILREKLETNKIDKLINTFVWDKFEPEHSRKMIEDYLKKWEENRGLSYPRKKTVDKLKEDYPELKEIYSSSSGGVIRNWEQKWKNFRDAR